MIDYGTTFFTNSGYSFEVHRSPDALDIVISDRDGCKGVVGLHGEDLNELTLDELTGALINILGQCGGKSEGCHSSDGRAPQALLAMHRICNPDNQVRFLSGAMETKWLDCP